MDKDQFLELAKTDLSKHGFKLKLINKKHLFENIGNKSIRYSADFDEARKKIHIATRCGEWFPNFVHEYAHFIQFKKKTSFYKKSDPSYALTHEWVGGKDITEIQQHVINCINYEREAELTAIGLIQKYALEVNIPRYITDANFYLYSWGYLLKTRKWYNLPNKVATPKTANSILNTIDYLDYKESWFV
jgi:hypothetical protein